VTLERALEVIRLKQEADANRIIQDFAAEGIQVLNGRYGPYITDRKKNAKIPKDRDPKTLTLEECRTLLAAAPERGGRFGRWGRGKKAAAPAAASAGSAAAGPAPEAAASGAAGRKKRAAKAAAPAAAAVEQPEARARTKTPARAGRKHTAKAARKSAVRKARAVPKASLSRTRGAK
jgi:DNA topoisomerase-1